MTDHARKAAEEIVDALGLPHDHGTEEESGFAAIISRAIADSERELVEALEKITNRDWVSGCGSVHGNAELPGCEQFYKGYNAGLDYQFERTATVARAALAKRGRK